MCRRVFGESTESVFASVGISGYGFGGVVHRFSDVGFLGCGL